MEGDPVVAHRLDDGTDVDRPPVTSPARERRPGLSGKSSGVGDAQILGELIEGGSEAVLFAAIGLDGLEVLSRHLC